VLATIATARTADLAGHVALRPALTSGFHHAFVIGGVFAAVGAITSALFIPRVRPPTRVVTAAVETAEVNA
jgi:hypothetical protein